MCPNDGRAHNTCVLSSIETLNKAWNVGQKEQASPFVLRQERKDIVILNSNF